MASTYNDQPSKVIVRLKQSASETVGDITRIIGLMPAKSIIPVIDNLDLEANPRDSKLGNVTNDIQDSIREDENNPDNQLLPFKSNGLLIAASRCESLERERYQLEFVDHAIEGILDGGHNTLAYGTYILQEAMRALDKPQLKRRLIMTWSDFKSQWVACRSDIDSYLGLIRDDKDNLLENGISTLNFLIPTELIVPRDSSDELCVTNFTNSLLEICDARNNNAPLKEETKANKEGLLDSFHKLLKQRALLEEDENDKTFPDRVSWKTNDKGSIPVRNLIALAWIPLSCVSLVGHDKNDEKSSVVLAPSPVNVYSSKQRCLDKYIELMQDDRVTKATSAAQRELKNNEVSSALKIAADMPWLFDKIYELFPGYYDGSYGKIGAVKSMFNKQNQYTTPFLNHKVERPVPDGFIYPLVWGLHALMRRNDETGLIEWIIDDPVAFLNTDAFKNAIKQYSGIIQQSDYDPQKVGKGAFSYTGAENSIKLAYLTVKAGL